MKHRLISLFALLGLVACTLTYKYLATEPNAVTLTITMEDSPYIEDISVNHYKQWLEEQTGYSLIFNTVPTIYSGQDVADSITDGTLQTDILFSFDTQETDFFIPQTVNTLGTQGLLYPLDDLLEIGTSLHTITTNFTAYDLTTYLTAEDGHLYYVPQMDASKLATAGETLWLNIGWLEELGLSIPRTTTELTDVLTAFAADDPNGNGVQDEVAFASGGDTIYPCYNYLINAFVYNDTSNYRFYADEDGVQFAPTQESWRDAMIYLSNLYQNEKLSDLVSPLTTHQLSELASSGQDVLGAFTTNDIGQVVWNNHADILMRYIPISPIRTPSGISHATVSMPLPTVGAVIPTSSSHVEEALVLLNLMLSEEACNIAQYGEESVDWERATVTDLDSQGEKASLLVHANLERLSQNKHFANAGPYYVYPKIADHVSYTNFDTAYLNSRGFLAQQAYQPSRILSPIILSNHFYQCAVAIDAYTQQWILDFCSGKYDPKDDSVWSNYLSGYDTLGLSALQNYISENTAITSA